MSLRFTPEAASILRHAIREAAGVEVFAIGDVEGKQVVGVTVTCRGRRDQVNALLDRPNPGQVVIHNHPSGNLTPSEADMQLAGTYGDDGIGSVIVDSVVTRSNWVVEPHAPKRIDVEDAALQQFFYETLPTVLSDAEVREGQLTMARAVATALNHTETVVCEAGTGTGKSMAYLVPAALWAMANQSKVIVSTYTKALQGQLAGSDLPLLHRAGIDVRYAVLQGRNNYLCKRRLALADDEDAAVLGEGRGELDALVDWAATTVEGSRSELSFPVDGFLWERVESDTDLTLRTRCPNYSDCHYYAARRRAGGAHLIVVNHALLLVDLALRDAGAPGILPKYERVIIDEAHHLEDAATGAISRRLTLRILQRASAPLLNYRKRSGALARLVEQHATAGSALPERDWPLLEQRSLQAKGRVEDLREGGKALLESLASAVLDPRGQPLPITVQREEQALWNEGVAPAVAALAKTVDSAVGALDGALALFDDLALPVNRAQSVHDVRRARSRLSSQAAVARAFLEHDADTCRWLAPSRGRGQIHAGLFLAPIEVAQTLHRLLWERLPGTVATSATLTVSGRFDHWMHRVGVEPQHTHALPSPFDHATQALLALPRDLPRPDQPGFLDETSQRVVEAIQISDGGAFVLCTSYEAVRCYARALRDALPPDQPVLEQRSAGRVVLLERFRTNPRAVLVGTDSFWEGVSVKGAGLRLVVIPRLPFRVPTDPLQQARHDRIVDRGGDAFKTFTLPQAVIRLRQGYGRLIRSKTDQGTVLILDRRLHERTYGRIILRSLPPARRITGPWRRVREALEQFFSN